MSTAASKPEQDTPPAVPSFSYAQAARGRAPPPAPDKSNGELLSNTEEQGPKRPVSSDRARTSGFHAKSSSNRTASEGRLPDNADKIEGSDIRLERKDPIEVGVNGPSTTPSNNVEASKSAVNATTPELGSTSNSTLPKDEDGFSAVNGSSDSTWERHSQSSQNGVNASENATSSEQTETPANGKWEEENPNNGGYKEAPPPAMNIWQQRKESLAAKAKTVAAPNSQGLSSKKPGESNATNGFAKDIELNGDSKRSESRKKGKYPGDDKSQVEMPQPISKDRTRKAANEEKIASTTVPPPPPPGDAVSWPTPENAIDEKKKAQAQSKPDDGDKDKEAPHKTKSSGKKAWTQMDFVPTAVFETHVPQNRRGGRRTSASRENPRGRNNPAMSRGTEKSTVASTPVTPQVTVDDSKSAHSSVATSNKSKRSSSAGPTSSKELRKQGESVYLEKGKDVIKEEGRATQPRKSSANDPRKQTATFIPATPQIQIPTGRVPPPDSHASLQLQGNFNDAEKKNKSDSPESNEQQRNFSGNGRKFEGSTRPNESSKESHGSGSTRDERGGRGRGGRGRGGPMHITYNGVTANGSAYQHGQGYPYSATYPAPPRSFSNHERTPSQAPSSFFPTSPHRSYRSSSSRSNYTSGYTNNGSRYPQSPDAGHPHLPNIQTDLANMAYFAPGPQGVMSAVPYEAYMQPVSVWDMVQQQMEYYFSVDNLCKDLFLRKHMDSQGFVFLSVLTNFNRIVQLTQDIELIRYVCLNSQKIEFKPGQLWQDGSDRLRVREGWSNFILPKEQRDSSVQNDGPIPANQHLGESSSVTEDQSVASPRGSTVNDPSEFPFQSLNAMAPLDVQASMQTTLPDTPSTLPNGNHPSGNAVPLSAAVSEFSPTSHTLARRRTPDPRPHETTAFPDEEVQKLEVLVRQSVGSPIRPFHDASSRTFSNGSIDGRNISDELAKHAERQSRAANGDVFESKDRSARSRSPFVVRSPSRRPEANSSHAVFWMKNRDGASALGSMPNDCATEPYVEFRRVALAEREQAPPGKQLSNMQNLYSFWSHFLIRNFNAGMYEEFRKLAIEDKTAHDSTTGLRSLMEYYDEALLSQRAILDDNIARHYVEFVQNEDRNGDRLAFKKLRAAWRNGAFNHMNRHKIVKLVDDTLKEELDR